MLAIVLEEHVTHHIADEEAPRLSTRNHAIRSAKTSDECVPNAVLEPVWKSMDEALEGLHHLFDVL
jgi:hypothetical protein